MSSTKLLLYSDMLRYVTCELNLLSFFLPNLPYIPMANWVKIYFFKLGKELSKG